MMSDKERISLYVSKKTAKAFRDAVRERYGKVDGNMSTAGESALVEWSDNDRAARNEDKLDEVYTLVSQIAAEREKESNGGGAGDISAKEKREKIIERLQSGNTWVDRSTVNRVIRVVADIHADKSVKQHFQRLKDEGSLLAHPTEDGKWTHSRRTLVMYCESANDVDSQYIDHIVGEHEPILGEDWYVESVPDPFMDELLLKYDRAVAAASDSHDYREANDIGHPTCDGECGVDCAVAGYREEHDLPAPACEREQTTATGDTATGVSGS